MFLAIGRFKDYDGVSKSRAFSVEVKFEEKSRDTFNLAFEVSCNGKPSGLTTTRAKKWVHVIPIDERRMCCYEFDVEALRDKLRNARSVFGGDRNASEMKLLPLLEARELCQHFELEIDFEKYQPYWV